MDEPWRTLGGVAVGAGLAAGGSVLALRSLLRPLPVRGIPVLRFGLVGPPRAGSPLNDLRLAPSRFEPFVRYVARRGFRAVTLSEAIQRRRERAFLASRPVALTFDGPFQTFRLAAWPVLQRHGLTAITLFYPPARLGQTELGFAEGRPEPLLTADDLVALTQSGVEVGLWTRAAAEEREADLPTRLTQERSALAAVLDAPVRCAAAAMPSQSLIQAARSLEFLGLGGDGHGFFDAHGSAWPIPRFAVTPEATAFDLALVIGRRVGRAVW